MDARDFSSAGGSRSGLTLTAEALVKRLSVAITSRRSSTGVPRPRHRLRRLVDCDEKLIGSSVNVVDSDADGVPAGDHQARRLAGAAVHRVAPIGDGALVMPGALVNKDVAAHTRVSGTAAVARAPARRRRSPNEGAAVPR
jgi:hypothetical protein